MLLFIMFWYGVWLQLIKTMTKLAKLMVMSLDDNKHHVTLNTKVTFALAKLIVRVSMTNQYHLTYRTVCQTSVPTYSGGL